MCILVPLIYWWVFHCSSSRRSSRRSKMSRPSRLRRLSSNSKDASAINAVLQCIRSAEELELAVLRAPQNVSNLDIKACFEQLKVASEQATVDSSRVVAQMQTLGLIPSRHYDGSKLSIGDVLDRTLHLSVSPVILQEFIQISIRSIAECDGCGIHERDPVSFLTCWEIDENDYSLAYSFARRFGAPKPNNRCSVCKKANDTIRDKICKLPSLLIVSNPKFNQFKFPVVGLDLSWYVYGTNYQSVFDLIALAFNKDGLPAVCVFDQVHGSWSIVQDVCVSSIEENQVGTLVPELMIYRLRMHYPDPARRAAMDMDALSESQSRVVSVELPAQSQRLRVDAF